MQTSVVFAVVFVALGSLMRQTSSPKRVLQIQNNASLVRPRLARRRAQARQRVALAVLITMNLGRKHRRQTRTNRSRELW